jgi:hypothetical protein
MLKRTYVYLWARACVVHLLYELVYCITYVSNLTKEKFYVLVSMMEIPAGV